MSTNFPKYIVLYSNDTYKLALDRETVNKLVLDDDMRMIMTVYEITDGFMVHKKSTTKWTSILTKADE